MDDTQQPGARRVPLLSTILQRSILLGAALAMLLFALPLGVAVEGLYRNQTAGDVARDAERARAELNDRVLEALREGEVRGLELYRAALTDETMDAPGRELLIATLIPGKERHLVILDELIRRIQD